MRGVFALWALLLLTACSEPDQTDKRTSSISEAGAVSAIRNYHSAWEALDFEKVASFHASDFEYLFFTELVEAGAFPGILNDVWMKGVVEYQIDETDFRVLLLPSDYANVTLQFADRSVYGDGAVVQTTGSMTYLLQKAENEWKIRRLHHAGPLPPEFGGE